MTMHERETLKRLCAKVLEEKDRVRFTKLLVELNALLEKRVGSPEIKSED